jgi:hypothetical protein
MKLNTLYVFAAISIHGGVSLALPLLRRAAPTLKVVTKAQPDAAGDDFCSPDQVAALRAGMTEAKTMATAASRVLAQQDVTKSEGVTTWLGTST